MRKGQIEFIGMVIIVILISLGFVFYIKFGILGKKVDEIGPAYQSVFASNAMGGVLNYVPRGDDKDMAEFLLSCSYGDNSVCVFVRSEIEKIFRVVMSKGDFSRYYFYGSNDDGIFIEIDEDCKDRNGITSSEYLIKDSRFVLKICK